MDLNASPSPYPLPQIYDIDHDHQLQLIPFGKVSFFSSTQDHTMYGHRDLGLSRQDHYRSDAYGDGYSSYEIKNKVDSSDFKLSLSKKFEDQVHGSMLENTSTATTSPRMIHKIKNATTPDRVSIKIVRSGNKKIEDQNFQHRSYSSSSSSDVYEPSNESPPHNNHMMMSPVRVCTDCNTTKTPLWRSGPKGPKSLCNACGIRQRKARRAMAAAAATGMAVTTTKQPRSMKTKIRCKEKASKNNYQNASSPLKKRFKNTVADHASNIIGPSASNGSRKKIGIVEDFLMNWSNNLALHRVFPQDEKDAAILLMAISSGLVHG